MLKRALLLSTLITSTLMAENKRIGFITCDQLDRYHSNEGVSPLITPDDAFASRALEKKGYQVEPLLWSSSPSSINEKKCDLLIVRSPWDYSDSEEKREAFKSWLLELNRSGERLINPVALMLWNLDKHYLGDLAKLGVNVVPTEYLDKEGSVDLTNRENIVVKPCISAGANDTYHLSTTDEAKRFASKFEEIRKGRDFMLQPFLKEVQSKGEWSLIFLDGKQTHAIRKRPAEGHWLVQEEFGGSVESSEPSDEVKAVAEFAFSKISEASNVSEEPFYARIDIIESEEFGPVIGEIELIEPELFFRTSESAAEAFAEGVEKRLAQVLLKS